MIGTCVYMFCACLSCAMQDMFRYNYFVVLLIIIISFSMMDVVRMNVVSLSMRILLHVIVAVVAYTCVVDHGVNVKRVSCENCAGTICFLFYMFIIWWESFLCTFEYRCMKLNLRCVLK